MKRLVKFAVAVGMAGALTLAAATPSLARYRHWGPAVGAGIVTGTVVGAGIANRQYYSGPYAYSTYGSDDFAYAPGYDAYNYAPRGYRAFGYAPGDNQSYDRERQLRGTDY